VALEVENLDFPSWEDVMSPVSGREGGRGVYRPRPGHADLAGGMKYRHRDLRNVLERASARETAMRVAVGAVCRQLLEVFSMPVVSQVLSIGKETATPAAIAGDRLDEVRGAVESSPVRCADAEASARMVAAIDAARRDGESLGGSFEVAVLNVPPGLGSHAQWDRRLDCRLAAAVMSVPAVKAVEIGDGMTVAGLRGSLAQDAIYCDAQRGVHRLTNRAGGVEGGISNGEPLRVRGYMKPIPTMYRPLPSVDLRTGEAAQAAVERSDICAVPAAAVVAEAVVAWVVADAFLEKFGGDSLEEVADNYRRHLQYLREVWRWTGTSFS
jgi:chorismate synthase